MNKEEFVNKAAIRHGSKYSYSNTIYKNSKIKVVITCPVHGDFAQLANGHLQGKGCYKCGRQLMATKQSLTHKEYVRKTTKKHKGQYTYNNTVYLNSGKKIQITCPVHGEFWQKANDHLAGRGCIQCARALQGWSYSSWEAQGNQSKWFEEFKVYVVKFTHNNEKFYKIGKTFTSLKRRLSKDLGPYSTEVVAVYKGPAREMSELEHTLHSINKSSAYTPGIDFPGMYECFSNYLEISNIQGGL